MLVVEPVMSCSFCSPEDLSGMSMQEPVQNMIAGVVVCWYIGVVVDLATILLCGVWRLFSC